MRPMHVLSALLVVLATTLPAMADGGGRGRNRDNRGYGNRPGVQAVNQGGGAVCLPGQAQGQQSNQIYNGPVYGNGPAYGGQQQVSVYETPIYGRQQRVGFNRRPGHFHQQPVAVYRRPVYFAQPVVVYNQGGRGRQQRQSGPGFTFQIRL